MSPGANRSLGGVGIGCRFRAKAPVHGLLSCKEPRGEAVNVVVVQNGGGGGHLVSRGKDGPLGLEGECLPCACPARFFDYDFCACTAQLHARHYGSLTLLLTVLNPMTLRRLLRKVQSPVRRSLGKLQTTLTSLHELEVGLSFESVTPECLLAGFDLLTLNVEHTIKTKIVALRQLLQWSGYPAVVLLQEVGVLPSCFAFHCLYWHTFTVISSSSNGVAVLVRRDSQLHIGDFTHHPQARAIVLERTYCDTPIQAANAYLSAKGTAKEYRPLLQWLHAHVTPNLRLVLLGGYLQCNLGWWTDCVSVHGNRSGLARVCGRHAFASFRSWHVGAHMGQCAGFRGSSGLLSESQRIPGDWCCSCRK